MYFENLDLFTNDPCIPTKKDYIGLRDKCILEKKKSPKIPLIEIIIDFIKKYEFELESIAEFIKVDKTFYSALKYDCENLRLIETNNLYSQINLTDLFK